MCRINIAGAGLSGLSAAISLAEQGVASNLISAQPSERAQSVLAEGGINGALDLMDEADTVAEHFADTVRGGVFLADPNAVAGMTAAAPDLIRWLHGLGVPFNMDRGHLIQRNFGGQKKKRTAYAKSSTGKILMSALIDEARKYEAAGLIHRFSHHQVTDLTIQEGLCTGLTIWDSYTGTVIACPGPVILCTGGMNGIFPGMTTGTTSNTGDVTALALARGVELANLEFIQYHPTTAPVPGKRLLLSEAARGEGGRLYIEKNGSPWYFLEERYPELGNLMPRDVISREMVQALARADCGEQVYLDLTGLSREIWQDKLPDLRDEIRHYLQIDPAVRSVPVSPGIHFFMGGIHVDAAHRTSLPGLYAAGECACQYHGANRLGGNSMLGAVYGGRVAAASALERPAGSGVPTEAGNPAYSAPPPNQVLCGILAQGLGIFRDQISLEYALAEVETLLTETADPIQRRRVLLGKAMLLSALARRESRGAHARLDFPDRDDRQFQKTTVVRMTGEQISLDFRSIPERSVEV